jgi:hypothetical protein
MLKLTVTGSENWVPSGEKSKIGVYPAIPAGRLFDDDVTVMVWAVDSAPAGTCRVTSSSVTAPPAEVMVDDDWLPLPLHVTGWPPWQRPLRQVSACVQALPSLHGVASATAGPVEQAPVVVLHVPAVWHWSGAVHVRGFPPEQIPPWQVSVWVHALPSLHVVPLLAIGFEQAPVDTSHAPALWHWSLAVHVFGVPPLHAPDWHVSPVVHALLSLHVVPLVLATAAGHPLAGTQAPIVWH